MKRNLLLTCATLATIFVCSSGQAADMPVKARPLPPAPLPYSWTGFYIGGNFGGVWSNVDIFDSEGNSFSTSGVSGGMAGGQIGFNYQFNTFVLGVEFEGDWTGLKRTSGIVDVLGFPLQAQVKTESIVSLAARFGFAADRFFLYGKAGVGWVNNKLTVTNTDTLDFIERSNTRSGLLLGIGGEYAIQASNWTVKLEYDHINLGSRSITDTNCVFICDYTITAKRNVDMFKFGFNYKLGGFGGPVAGPY
jgi:outer membrane immunogenic protein